MSGRIAIDFGTSNTVIAVWNEERGEGVPLHLSGYGRQINYRRGNDAAEQISLVPSLIHYSADNHHWLGQQVLGRNLYESERTFRWMKRYISRRSPVKMRLDGRELSHADAGRDFLSAVLKTAAAEVNLQDEEIALTAPVEAFEHYEDWLTGVAETAGITRFRLIDEASAAALGYGVHVQPGDVYFVFDFGGGTLDVSVVLIDESRLDRGEEYGGTGRRCRVLGKAGADIGGATIDQWLFQEVLRQADRGDGDEDVRQMSRALLVACERAKERLSFQKRAEVRVEHPETAAVLSAELTQDRLEDLLDRHEFFTQIDQTIRRGLNASRERGYDEEHVKAVLLVGGTTLMPSVQRFVQRRFGRERVLLQRPLDAVARGAAAFVAGVDFYDHIQHDYAIRHVEARTGKYEYRVIVKHGTAYPTREPLAQMTVKASHEGQEQLGLAIFELAASSSRPGDAGQPLELVFDLSGAARVREVTPDERDRRHQFWINESNPTFLEADPPARQGEPRFEVEFGIDGNKRLLVTARDVQTKRMVLRNYPVVKLT